MSLIYSVIARSKKIVLCEYTDFTGNFPQITISLLPKVKSNKKCVIDYNE